MPYKGVSDPNLPDYAKKLSSRLKKIWISSYNSAYKNYDASKHGDSKEAYAFKVANAAVKKAKSKKESIEFPKDTQFASNFELEEYSELLEELVEVKEKTYNINENIIISLKDSKIDKESKTADIIAIESGWSYNGNYYTKPVAESLAQLMLQRRKIFANHTNEKEFGRNVLIWAATVEEAIGKDGKTSSKIRFTDNPASTWLFEEAQVHPEEVQFSIDAIARVHEGEMEGRKGLIVDKFIKLNSLDIVDYAAAGGVVQRTYASKAVSELSILQEAAAALKDRVAKRVDQNKLYILMDIFQNMLYELSWTIEEEDNKSKKDKIEKLVDDFLEEFENIDIVKAFESKQIKDGDNMSLTLAEVKKEHPEIVDALKKELAESEAAKAKEAELKGFKDKSEALESKVKTLEEDVKTRDSELKTATEELNKYKFKEELVERETLIRGIVKESELGNYDDLPEYLRKDLMSKKEEEDIKNTVKALEAISKNKSGKVEGAGVTKPVPDGKETKIDESLATDNDKAARVFN